jgi:ribosomal protein S1
VDGLIHKGEHGWGNILSQGSVAPHGVIGPLRVIGYDSLRGTPLFSHRQALPNPWTATSVGDLKVGEFYEAHLNCNPKRFNKISPWGYVKLLLFPGFAIECCLPDHEIYEAIIHFNPLLLVRITFIDPQARRILGELIPREKLHLGAKLKVVVYDEHIDDGYKVFAVNALVFAFLPYSEMITRTQIGATLSVEVIQKENESGLTVVGQIGAKGEIANLAEGRFREIVSGIVTSITNHYALIDLGSGVKGLLHKNELAYHCVRHPSKILSLKQKITVKVISIDVQKGNVFLSLKQLQPDPWQTEMASQFPEGSTHLGLVTQLMSYGAFIELAPGLEGLLDNTEIDWNRENQNQARTQFKVGQELLVYIKKLDKVQHQMSLTRLLPALWKDGEYVASQFPEGSEHLGKLTKLAFQEAFIELAPRIEGVLRYIDIGFSTAKNIFQVGKTIKVRIKKLDFEKGLIALTICSRTKIQLQGCNGFQGRIVKLLDTGAIIKLESGLEGSLIQNSAKALFELGQSIRVFVVNKKKTTWLTIRPFFAKPEKVLFLESDKFFSWYERATTDKEPVVCQKLASELTTELKKVPDSVALRLYLAEVWCCLGNELQALSVLQEGIRLTPYEQELSQRAFNLARQLGKDSFARQIAQDALNGPLEKQIRQGFKSFLDIETPKEHQTLLKTKMRADDDWKWKQEVYD